MKKRSKTKILSFFIIALLISTGLTLLYLHNRSVSRNKNLINMNNIDEKVYQNNDNSLVKSQRNKNYSSETQNQTTHESSSIKVSITSYNVTSQNVQIGTMVYGASSGECKLTMTNGNNKIEKKANVTLQVSYYLCQGFNLSISEFATKGDWNAIVELSSSSGIAKSENRKISIQ